MASAVAVLRSLGERRLKVRGSRIEQLAPGLHLAAACGRQAGKGLAPKQERIASDPLCLKALGGRHRVLLSDGVECEVGRLSEGADPALQILHVVICIEQIGHVKDTAHTRILVIIIVGKNLKQLGIVAHGLRQLLLCS